MARQQFDMTVAVDTRGATRYLTQVQRRVVPKASAFALNRVARTVRADAASAKGPIRKNRNIKVSEIKRRIFIFKATTRKQAAQLLGKQVGVPIIDYAGVTQPKKGTGVNVNIKGQRVKIRGAFIHTFRSGHKGVFQRLGKKRLPIAELYSTTVADAMDNQPVREAMINKAISRWAIEFERELAFALSKVR